MFYYHDIYLYYIEIISQYNVLCVKYTPKNYIEKVIKRVRRLNDDVDIDISKINIVEFVDDLNIISFNK